LHRLVTLAPLHQPYNIAAIEAVQRRLPDVKQVAEVVQAMAAEAGFDLKIKLTEFATSLSEATKGNFQLYLIGWSGRVDPDQNVINHLGCNTPFNWGKYCNETTQNALNAARTVTDPAKRKSALAASCAAHPSCSVVAMCWCFTKTAYMGVRPPFRGSFVVR